MHPYSFTMTPVNGKSEIHARTHRRNADKKEKQTVGK